MRSAIEADELLSGQENRYMIGRLTGLTRAGSRKRAGGSMSFVARVRPPDDRADERRQGVCVRPREGIDGAHRLEKGSDR